MIHIVIYPADPLLFEFPMIKFKFITDDYSIAFVVKDKFSERLLRETLVDIPSNELDSIVQVILQELEEESVGETEFSEITSVATIKRVLPSEN